MDLDDREPVVEVAAEAAARDLAEHVAVRGRDDAHVVPLALAAAERHDLAGLEHAQELGLQRDRQVADLVEEQRAAVRRGERALAIAGGAGERALDVAEQVALDQRLGRRAAVEHDERAVLARRRVVDAARHQLLAGAALAEEQHRRVRLARRARAPRTPGASRWLPPYSAPNRSFVDGGMSTTSSAGISCTSVLPMRIATPGGATTLPTATPSMTVPFLEPRSVIAKPCGVGEIEQWRRDTNASVSTTSHVALGADHHADRRQLDLEAAIRPVDDAQLGRPHVRTRGRRRW